MRGLWAVACLCPSIALGADDAASLLARARTVMGLERAGQSILPYRAVTASGAEHQSDGSYPPFFPAMAVIEELLRR